MGHWVAVSSFLGFPEEQVRMLLAAPACRQDHDGHGEGWLSSPQTAVGLGPSLLAAFCTLIHPAACPDTSPILVLTHPTSVPQRVLCPPGCWDVPGNPCWKCLQEGHGAQLCLGCSSHGVRERWWCHRGQEGCREGMMLGRDDDDDVAAGMMWLTWLGSGLEAAGCRQWGNWWACATECRH